MIEKYLVDGRIFNVHPSQKEAFLKKYPNAILQTESIEKSDKSEINKSSLQIEPKKFVKKKYEDYTIKDFNDYPKEIKNQFLTEQFEANKLDVEESFDMLKRQKEIEEKEAQLNKFFSSKNVYAIDRGGNEVFNMKGFNKDYKPTKEELENPLYQNFFNPDGTIKSEEEITILRDQINDEEESLLESEDFKKVDKIG
jgi:hypothetical protein